MITSPHPEAITLAQSAAEVATAAMSTGLPPEAGILARARSELERALQMAPADLEVLFRAYQFHFRLGELDLAEEYCQRRLKIAAPDTADQARALTNLGLIAQFRNDLEQAEERMMRAVEIDRRIGNIEGLARDVGNLALVYEARGDLIRAEALFREALELAGNVPGDRGEELAAGNTANLGDIALARGQLDQARRMWTEAVAIFERLGITKWKASFEKKFAELHRASAGQS